MYKVMCYVKGKDNCVYGFLMNRMLQFFDRVSFIRHQYLSN